MFPYTFPIILSIAVFEKISLQSIVNQVNKGRSAFCRTQGLASKPRRVIRVSNG